MLHRFAHVYLSGQSQHVVLNLAYVTTGVYLWEAVQSSLHDIWITYMFANRLCLLLGIISQRDSARSVNRRSASTVASFESSASSPQPPTSSDSDTPIWGSLLFNSLAQLNYLLLRLSTCLSLISLFVLLSSRTSDLTSNVYNGLYTSSLLNDSAECAIGDLRDEGTPCDTSRTIRFISLLAPLVSFAVSNSFLFLLALSIWSTYRRLMSATRYPRTSQEEGQTRLSCHVELKLHRYARGKVLAPICLLLHAVQFALIVLTGISASEIESPGNKEVRKRGLVLGTFAYFALLDLFALALIVVGIMCWRHSKPSSMMMEDDGVDDREERVAFGYQDSAVKCAEASASCHGRDSSVTLSDMSFARQNESFNYGSAQTNDHVPFLSPEEPRWTDVTWDDNAAAVGIRTPHGSRTDCDRILVSEENRRDVENTAGRRTCLCESQSEGEADGRSHGVDSYGMAEETTGVWVHVYTEGRRQGLLWAMIIVLMKIALFVCVFVDSMRTHDELVGSLDFQYLCFVVPALAIIAIASGRLFLHITQVSPLGDGFISSTSSSPQFSPSNSTIEFATSATRHDQPPRRLSMTSRSIRRSQAGLLPSYVDRSRYKRRVRREVETAASGAVRTIGGSMLLPPPALVSEPRRWRKNSR